MDVEQHAAWICADSAAGSTLKTSRGSPGAGNLLIPAMVRVPDSTDLVYQQAASESSWANHPDSMHVSAPPICAI